MSPRAVLATALAVAVLTAACGTAELSADPGPGLRIMVPNAAGGGYDTTARIAARVLEDEQVAERPEIFHVEGAGGTVGLARMVHERGNADLLMVMGLGLVGSVHTHETPVSLEDVTPIARLLSEPEVLMVRTDSPYRDVAGLVGAWRESPGRLVVGGGSEPGGPDHLATHLLAEAVGIDLREVRYRKYDGGGPLLAALFTGEVDVAVSGVLENIDQVRTGAVRVLAVTGDGRVPGVEAPTLEEAGVPLVFENWRGLVAPPGLDDAERDRLIDVADAMHGSASWRRAVEDNGWSDDYLTGHELEAFLDREAVRVRTLLERLGTDADTLTP